MPGQVIQITINVTDGNAAEAVQQVVAQLNAIGPAGESAGATAGAGLDQVGEHAITAREQVRLASEELGVHMPRAMQSVIGQSQMMMGAFSAIMPAMIAIGGVDILYHIGEGVYNLYEKFIELKPAIEASGAVIKSFGDQGEAALNRAYDAMEKYIRLTQGAKNADIYGLNRTENTAIKLPEYQSKEFQGLPQDMKAGFENITGESVMPKDLPETIAKLQTYQGLLVSTLQAMQSVHHTSGWDVLLGRNDPNAAAGPDISRLDTSDQAVTKQMQAVREGASIIKDLLDQQVNSGAQQMSQQAQIDKDKPGTGGQQQAIEKEKQKLKAIGDLQQQARESELTGNALVDAQREKALGDFVAKWGQSQDAMDAINQTYDEKLIALWQKEAEEADKKNAKIGAAQKTFDNEMNQIGTRAEDAQVSGYARIADEAERSAEKARTSWEKLAKTPGISPQAVQDAQSSGIATIVDVQGNALREMQQLHAKTMEQVTKEEEQAARLTLPEWQQSELAIEDTYKNRVRAYLESETQQLAATQTNAAARALIEQDYNQKTAAARAVMQAQLQKLDAETRDKYADGLKSMVSNPAQFIEKRAMDTAFQMMATDMQSFFKSDSMGGGMMQWLFGMGPQMTTTSTNPGDQLKSVLGGTHGASAGSGMTLSNAGTTLLNAGNMQLTAAQALQSAAGSLSMAGGGGGGMGGLGGSIPGLGSGMPLLGGSNTGLPPATDAMPGSSGVAGLMGQNGGSSSTWTSPAGNDMVNASSLGTVGESSNWSGDAANAQNGGSTGFNAGAVPGAAIGGITGGMGVLSAYENSDPVAGAMSGAMAGASIGSVFGPVGSVIGAAAGAIAGTLAGVFGDKGLGKAQDLNKNTVQPALLTDMQAYESGHSGYNTLAAELNSLDISAKNSTTSMGSGARNYYGSNIEPEIQLVLKSLQKQEIGGRGAVTMSGAQYHAGGSVGSFGDFATGPGEGFAKLLEEEFVVQPMAARAHAPLLSAINSGSVSYGSAVQPRMPAGSGGGGSVNLTIQAIDSKSVAQWARAGGGLALMAAMNQAQRQYSGVGRG
jgi:hypothetical protein